MAFENIPFGEDDNFPVQYLNPILNIFAYSFYIISVLLIKEQHQLLTLILSGFRIQLK